MSLAEKFPAPRIERWENQTGSSLEVRFIKPSVLLFTYRGVMVPEEIRFFEPMIDQVIAQGIRPVMFVDTFDAGRYAPAFRDETARWVKKIKDHAPPIAVLLRSKLVEMVLSLTNMVLSTPMGVPFSDEKKFEAAIRAAIAGAK